MLVEGCLNSTKYLTYCSYNNISDGERMKRKLLGLVIAMVSLGGVVSAKEGK